jgi:MFS family permease
MLLASIFLVFVGIGIQAVIFNLYLVAIGYEADFLGLFSFANTAAIGGSALVASPISKRFGLRRVLLVAISVLMISMAGFVSTRNALALIVLAVVNGVALAHIFVPSAPFIMDNARPDRRANAFAAYFAAQAFASMVGSVLGGVLPQVFSAAPAATPTGYAWTLVVAAAIAGAGFLPLKMADDSKEPDSHTSLVRQVERHSHGRQVRRDLIWMVVANALVAASTGFAIPFLNLFFDQKLGASTATIGVIFALGSGAMAVASLLGPAVGRRIGSVAAVVLGRGLSTPLLLALAFVPDVWSGAGLYVLRTLFFNLTWPVENAFAMELVPPDLRATLAALRSTSWNIGWSLASGLAGVMIVALGFSSIFVASAAFLLVGCAVYFVAFRSEQPAVSSDVPDPTSTP